MGYYGNPKYITEALINKKVDCKIIWLSKSYKAITSEKIKVIPFHTIRSVFHLCTANIWVDNCRKDYWTRKRNKQFYIQTWHGGIGPKCVEKDAIGKVSNEYSWVLSMTLRWQTYLFQIAILLLIHLEKTFGITKIFWRKDCLETIY